MTRKRFIAIIFASIASLFTPKAKADDDVIIISRRALETQLEYTKLRIKQSVANSNDQFTAMYISHQFAFKSVLRGDYAPDSSSAKARARQLEYLKAYLEKRKNAA